MKLITPIVTEKLNLLEDILTVLRLQNVTLSKSQASKIVGSRYVLERLVAIKKIRMVKPTNRQNGKWRCAADDVFQCVNYKEREKQER